MKPNFDEMSKAELKAYVLSHRDDDEAIRVLFSRRNPPDSEATWYKPMCTPEGVPIEENIRIAEEAIRQRAEHDKKKQREKELQKASELEGRLKHKIEQEQVSSRNNPMNTLKSEEIDKFRSQLANYPQAIADLDIIEACEGDLERSARVLARRAGAEDDRFVSNRLEQGIKQCRDAICEKEFKDDLLPELLETVKDSLAASSQPFLAALETPVTLYVAKVGVNTFCKSTDSVLGHKKGTLRLNWAGGLKDYAEQYTSLDLQQKALEWRGD